MLARWLWPRPSIFPSSPCISPVPSTQLSLLQPAHEGSFFNHKIGSFFYFKPSPLSCLPFFLPPSPHVCIWPTSYFLENEAIEPDPQFPATAPPSLAPSPFPPISQWMLPSWGQDLCSGSQLLLSSLESQVVTWLLSPVYSTLTWIWIFPFTFRHAQVSLKIKQNTCLNPEPLPAIIPPSLLPSEMSWMGCFSSAPLTLQFHHFR